MTAILRVGLVQYIFSLETQIRTHRFSPSVYKILISFALLCKNWSRIYYGKYGRLAAFNTKQSHLGKDGISSTHILRSRSRKRMNNNASPLTPLVQKWTTRSTFHGFSFSKRTATICHRLRLLSTKKPFSSHYTDLNPRSLLLHWYFQKKDTLEKNKQKQTNRVAVRLTRQEKWISSPMESRDYLEIMCRLPSFREWWSISVSPFQSCPGEDLECWHDPLGNC